MSESDRAAPTRPFGEAIAIGAVVPGTQSIAGGLGEFPAQAGVVIDAAR